MFCHKKSVFASKQKKRGSQSFLNIIQTESSLFYNVLYCSFIITIIPNQLENILYDCLPLKYTLIRSDPESSLDRPTFFCVSTHDKAAVDFSSFPVNCYVKPPCHTLMFSFYSAAQIMRVQAD